MLIVRTLTLHVFDWPSLRALSFCQNWLARPISLQGKFSNLKEHLHDNPSNSSGGGYIILEVC